MSVLMSVPIYNFLVQEIYLDRFIYRQNITAIECEGWRRHSILILLILLFTKPNIEVSGWLYHSKMHFTHLVHQPFSRVLPPSFTLYGNTINVPTNEKTQRTLVNSKKHSRWHIPTYQSMTQSTNLSLP